MGSATVIKDLEIDPKRAGRPRLDPYQRLLGRFYEQLFLLNALGQTRDNHTTSSWELDATRARRRQFLQNLCYICEFKKGGSACTAIGLEELDTCYNFCVASNNETDKIATFLQNVLNVLRAIAPQGGTNDTCRESNFFQLCIGFAAERIEQENKCLRRNVKDCLSKLNRQNAVSGVSVPFTYPIHATYGDLSSQLAFRASSLAFHTLIVMLGQISDPNMYPSVHVSMAFVWCLTLNPAAIQRLEPLVPWSLLATYLNTLFHPDTSISKIEDIPSS